MRDEDRKRLPFLTTAEAEAVKQKWLQHYPDLPKFHKAVEDGMRLFMKQVGEGMKKTYEVRDKHFRGKHADRYEKYPQRGEPLEFRFAERWSAQHGRSYKDGTLAHLLGDGQTPEEPTDRDYLVAATVIQWLGSPVGQSFLSEALGFDINNPKGRPQ